MGVQIPLCERAIFRGQDMPGYARRHSVISWAETAEPIEMVFGLLTRVDQRQHMLHGAHWRHLANTSEPSVCGGDAAYVKLL